MLELERWIYSLMCIVDLMMLALLTLLQYLLKLAQGQTLSLIQKVCAILTYCPTDEYRCDWIRWKIFPGITNKKIRGQRREMQNASTRDDLY